MNRRTLALAASCLFATATLSAQEGTIGFEALPAGAIVSTVDATSSGGPIGPIAVYGTKPSTGDDNVAMIFDSASPTGGDIDLGTPNETFGGPGIGDAGEAGQPNQNDLSLGHILCLAENLVDANGDGLIDSPDDADEEEMVLEFDFTGITSPFTVDSVTILSVTALDYQLAEGELPAVILLYGADDALIASFEFGDIGNNGKQTLLTGETGTEGVTRMEVISQGSGAIDSIVLLVDEPPEEEKDCKKKKKKCWTPPFANGCGPFGGYNHGFLKCFFGSHGHGGGLGWNSPGDCWQKPKKSKKCGKGNSRSRW